MLGVQIPYLGFSQVRLSQGKLGWEVQAIQSDVLLSLSCYL